MPTRLITVLDNTNQPIGPFSVDEVQRRMQAGEFRPNQLAHADGLTEWTPLSTVVAYATGGQMPPRFVTQGNVIPAASTGTYAGFWLRFAAYMLDTLLIMFVVYAFVFGLMLVASPHGLADIAKNGKNGANDMPDWVAILIMPVYLFGPLLYFACMESSAKQGTLGKMAVGIIVTDMQGQRISFWHAVGRTLAKIISALTCFLFYIGYIMAGFTERKQALHDMIASTLVLRK